MKKINIRYVYSIMFIVASLFFLMQFLSCAGPQIGGSSKRAYYGDRHKSYKKYKSSKSEGKKSKSIKDRMIIYRAFFAINVESVSGTLKHVYRVVKTYNGFIESAVTSDSYRAARIIIRVPVKKFYSAVKKIETMGSITKKEISASDVTREFNDVSLRIKTADKIRTRLYALLKRTNKVKDRIAILKEITRLTQIIESLKTRRNYLKNKAAFSTIILKLKAKVRQVVTRFIPSPFPWIAGLRAQGRSINRDYRKAEGKKPEGFFKLEKDFYDKKRSNFLYITPDEKSGIRIGVVKNKPKADLKFWNEAFTIEMKNRKYSQLHKESIKSKSVAFAVYYLKYFSERIYIVAFGVKDDSIIIIEALFKTKSITAHMKNTMKKYIQSVEFD